MERIEKPWGAEEIITLTDRYCMKRLTLNRGHRTSLQRHALKHETMYFLTGRATVEFGPSAEELDSTSVGPSDHVVVPPGVVHRVTAAENTTYIEASTPEMADVERLEDDYRRD